MRIGLACLALSLLAACQRDAASEDPSATKTLAGADAESRTIADRGDAARVLCSAEEQAIFSCKVDNGKRLAVCATAHGKAQYRYGETTPELVLDGGEWASVGYSGGGEAQIAFANGAARYVVFSRMVRTNFAPGEPNYPKITDGVVVMDDGKVTAIRLCDDDPDVLPIQYDAAEATMQKRDELFTNQTILADEAN